MRYRVLNKHKFINIGVVKIQYKKWYWIFWKDMGEEYSNKNHADRRVYELIVNGGHP